MSHATPFRLCTLSPVRTKVRSRQLTGLTRKLLEVEHVSHHCVLTQDALDRLQQPILVAGQRVAALRFGDPRLMALLQALIGFAYLRILRPNWAALLPDDDRLPRSLRAALDVLDREIQKVHEEAALAA
jgi:hypothetical protein